MRVPTLISSPEAVTAEWLDSVLQHSGDLGSAHVTGFESRSVGTGQVGENVRFTLEYDALCLQACFDTTVGVLCANNAVASELSFFFEVECSYSNQLIS